MSLRNPTIYIIIPVHNRLGATRECLQSLSVQSYKDFFVILIDDGSSDQTSEYVEKNYPEVVILKGDGELWWTGATNLGVSKALQYARHDDYILTLNNDTVLPPDYLKIMMSLSRQMPKALIGSIAVDYDRRDTVIDAGVKIHWFSAKFAKLKSSAATRDSFYEVSVLPGRGTLIPLEVFYNIGLYDDKDFPHYSADYDFSLRACRAGHALLLHPSCYLFSNTKLTGLSNVHNTIRFSSWLRSFDSVRSPNNIKTRVCFGLRHAPRFCRLSFVLCDLLRVTLGTLRNQVKNTVR